MTNFGWEYVWHCHLLGHEENDMMRPLIMNPATSPPGQSPRGLASNLPYPSPGQSHLGRTMPPTNPAGSGFKRTNVGTRGGTEVLHRTLMLMAPKF